MEYWDIYDIDRVKTGKIAKRHQGLQEGEYHLVVHVCIFNPKGEMLIQQRQPFKQGFPNLWDITVGGSALVNENSRDAASRELQEELGISIDFSHIRAHMNVNFDFGFDDIYLIETDLELSQLVLQPEEVQNVKWASESEILQMIANQTFIPYYPSLIQLFFASRKQYGCHQIYSKER